MQPDYLSYAYAVLIVVGGLIGYFKADSLASLISGVVFGAIIALGAYLVSKDAYNWYLILSVNVVLAGFMGYRFYETGKFMPAGIIMIISFLMVLRFTARALHWTDF